MVTLGTQIRSVHAENQCVSKVIFLLDTPEENLFLHFSSF